MKVLISYPATGQNKVIEIEDEKKVRPFYEKRMAQEVEADSLGDEWKVKFLLDVVWLYVFNRVLNS